LAHTTIGCGKQGFPSAQPYLSHTPAANPGCCMFLNFFILLLLYMCCLPPCPESQPKNINNRLIEILQLLRESTATQSQTSFPDRMA
ncbi:hypothetical protein P174DRAFT_366768, partial [Aspergillus novofumigatus IBT 16806]